MPFQWSRASRVPRIAENFTCETTRNSLFAHTKKAELAPRLFHVSQWLEYRSARIEFDDQVRFHLHRIGYFVQRRNAGEGGLVAFGGDVVGNFTLGQRLRFSDEGHFLGLLAEADHVARANATRGDVALHAVDVDVTVRNDLASREDGRRELGAVHDHVKALFEQADQVLTGVALHFRRFLVRALELLLGHVAVVALELLLGAELDAEVRDLALAALAVLARAIRAAVHRRLGTTPDVFAETAIHFVLGCLALGHALPFNLPAPATRRCFKSRTRTTLPIAKCGHRFTGSAGPIAKRGQEQTISPLSRAAAIDRVAKLGCYRK